MAIPLVAVPIGIGVSIGLEFIFSGGKASRRDYVVAGAVGAVPVGLGIGHTTKILQKAGRTVGYAKAGFSKKGISQIDKPLSKREFFMDTAAYWTPEIVLGVSGVAVAKAAGHIYDVSIQTSSTVTPGRGVSLPNQSRKPARSGKIGRRRKRCTHKDSRGRRCLRPAGHSGRHRYV